MADEDGNILVEIHMEEGSVPSTVRLDGGTDSVSKDEYIFYLRARKRIMFNEPIPESTFTDVQNPVLRRRLVRAICLRKATQKSPDTKDGPVTPMT